MMPQEGRGQTLEYRGKKRKTRREISLERMDALIPCQRWEDRMQSPAFARAVSSVQSLETASGPANCR